MTELSPEEKKKIYEEEKARIEAQEQLKKEKETKEKKTNWGGIIVLLIVIVAVMYICGVFDSDRKKSSAPSEPLYVDLNASVRFDGKQFIITNNDTFDWTNVELEVNPGLLKSGFILKTSRMSSGETYTVGAMQFAKGDGTRFNPFQMKPQKFQISCDTPKGKGFYSGGWN